MAEKPANRNREAQESEAASTKSSGRLFDRFVKHYWWAWLIAFTLLLHGCLAVWLTRTAPHRGESTLAPAEIALGEYRFTVPAGSPSSIQGANFELYVSMLPELEATARPLLEQRTHRVRQDIESLLRQAHGADFEDPRLNGLKRQIREQINETLGVRAIADAVVTGLTFDYGNPIATPSAEQPAPAASAAVRTGATEIAATPADVSTAAASEVTASAAWHETP